MGYRGRLPQASAVAYLLAATRLSLGAQAAGSFDDFLVRRYTEREPTLTLGSEGPKP